MRTKRRHIETVHALALAGPVLLLPLLMRIPPFAALLIAGAYAILLLSNLICAAFRSRTATGLIAVAMCAGFGWLVWFTYQY